MQLMRFIKSSHLNTHTFELIPKTVEFCGVAQRRSFWQIFGGGPVNMAILEFVVILINWQTIGMN